MTDTNYKRFHGGNVMRKYGEPCRPSDWGGEPGRPSDCGPDTLVWRQTRVSGPPFPAMMVALFIGSLAWGDRAPAQEAVKPTRGQEQSQRPELKAPTAPIGQQPLPINLPTAFQLANAQALDVAIASQRIEVALAQLQRAQNLWLPTIYLGTDYYRHDGQIQETPGNVFGTSRTSFMVGAGPSAVFAVSDAIFEPLAARQIVRAREAAFQTASNDTMLAGAQAYFGVQQARGGLARAQDAAPRGQ